MEYEKEIYASYNRDHIRVYQAYKPEIADEAVCLQNFGEHFNVRRMTWIKPSFLWMMYRSNWGTKKDQECILGIDIHRAVFENLLSQAVLTSPDYENSGEWEKDFGKTEVYVQWDPDRSISGNPIGRAAIQVGIKGAALEYLLSEGIYRIENITPLVRKSNEQRKNGRLSAKNLPTERLYPIGDKNIRKKLGMKL